MKERSSSVPGQGLTKEARNIIDDVLCHDGVCLVVTTVSYGVV